MAKHIFFRPGKRQRFLTLATHQRSRMLIEHAATVVDAWRTVEQMHGMELLCWAVLPDHMHAVIDTHFNKTSALAHAFKLETAKVFNSSNVAGRGALWESRFWDQPIDDKQALDRHIDFVHYNPVRHGLAAKPWDYPFSSFREFVRHGYYFKDWTLTADRRGELVYLDSNDLS